MAAIEHDPPKIACSIEGSFSRQGVQSWGGQRSIAHFIAAKSP